MRLTYFKSFIKKYLKTLKENYRSSDYNGKRELKNYIYSNIKLTEYEKDKIWKEIIGY